MYIRIKWALFGIGSTTVIIVLHLEDSESSTTKSILRVSYTGNRYSSPIEKYLTAFV